ncbi:MAG: lytic murein transglycosylase B [Gammaproteobacteria bacterium]|nr:lytic murein transglycosylase B [Gammaproteobacteria bacterium]MDH5736302.1 lytic murein transglycosylase B [Gammaproteobacteria bacterium]
MLVIISLFGALTSQAVVAAYHQRDDVQNFIAEMVEQYGFDKNHLTELMSKVEKQTTAIEAIARPAEGKPWKEYRPIFLTKKRIQKGVEFWRQHYDELTRAENDYGVPAEIIVAIIGVETFYGRRAGNYSVLDALTTLGFDYPLENTTKERQQSREIFFRKELKEYLLMSREEKVDPRSLKGSYAGAMGMPQFISSSFRAYAVDYDGDGKRDLWTSTADAIGSVANYFKRHGWVKGKPIVARAQVTNKARELGSKDMKPHTSIKNFKQQGAVPLQSFADNELATLLELDGSKGSEYWLGLNNFYVITRYNHSPLYAMAVYQLGQAVATEYFASR